MPQTALTGAAALPEAAPLPIWEEYVQTMAQDPRVRGKVDCYCAWTRELADYLGAQGHYDQRRVLVTGTPRSDFYAEPWRTAASVCAGHRSLYGERMILVNGSFPLANPRFQTPEREVEQLIQEFSYDPAFAHRWQGTQLAALRGMVALVNRLAARFPDVAFVYRPHPFEGTEYYRALLEPRSNLHLVKEGTVDGWLLSARAMIHWESSTAIEGNLARIPVFNPGWLPVHLPVPFVDAVSIRPAREEELVAQLEAVLAGSFRIPAEIQRASEAIARQVFHQIDGRSHERVADAVVSALLARTSRPDPSACERLAGVGWQQDWRASVEKWDASEKRFTAAQIQRMLDALERVDPRSDARLRAPSLATGHAPFALPASRSVVLPSGAPRHPAGSGLAAYPKLESAIRRMRRSWRDGARAS